MQKEYLEQRKLEKEASAKEKAEKGLLNIVGRKTCLLKIPIEVL